MNFVPLVSSTARLESRGDRPQEKRCSQFSVRVVFCVTVCRESSACDHTPNRTPHYTRRTLRESAGNVQLKPSKGERRPDCFHF